MATKLQIRRDTAANWTTANPILAQGEPAYEIDTNRLKIGDGTTDYNALPYKFESSLVESPTGVFTHTDELNTVTVIDISSFASSSAVAANSVAIADLEAEQTVQDTSIAANLAATGVNSTNIVNNTTDISNNATDIIALQSEQTIQNTNITTNTTSIFTNTTDIATNVTDINILQAEQATQDASIAANVAAIAAIPPAPVDSVNGDTGAVVVSTLRSPDNNLELITGMNNGNISVNDRRIIDIALLPTMPNHVPSKQYVDQVRYKKAVSENNPQINDSIVSQIYLDSGTAFNLPVVGDYIVGVGFTYSHDSSTSDFRGFVTVDTTTTEIIRHEPQDSAGTGIVVPNQADGISETTGTNQRFSVYKEFHLTGQAVGVLPVNISWQTSTNGVESAIYSAVITVEKLSD